MSKESYLVSWNVDGLQCLFNATTWQKKHMWAVLKDRDYPQGPNLMELLIEASRNPELQYEIYSFEVDEGLTEDMIRQAFESNPQGIVDLIRSQGDKMFSDRPDKVIR